MKKDSILFQIKSLEKMVARYFIKRGDLGNFPRPTPTQMQIMDYLLESNKKEFFQKDLENILELRRATVSGVLQTMEKNNLIERVTNVDDTRTKKIIINKKAREIFSRNEKKMKELEILITKGVSEEELENFSKVTEKMKNNMKVLE